MCVWCVARQRDRKGKYLLHPHVSGAIVEGEHGIEYHDHGQRQHKNGHKPRRPLRDGLFPCRIIVRVRAGELFEDALKR